MNPRCANVITQVGAKLGRKVGANELRNIEQKIRDATKAVQAKDRQAFVSMTPQERMNAAVEYLAAEVEHQRIRKAENASKVIQKKAALLNAAQTAANDGVNPFKFLEYVIGFSGDVRSKRPVSVESRAKAYEHSFLEMIRGVHDLDHAKFLGIMSNKQGMRDVAMELKGVNSGNADAKNAAQAITNMRETLIKEYNERGGDIRLLKNFDIHQALDGEKMLGSRFRKAVSEKFGQGKYFKERMNTWVDEAITRIDRNTLMKEDGTLYSDAEARSFLEESFYTLVSDGQYKERKVGEGTSIVANRHRQHRQLHWKDYDSYIYMQEKYGAGTLYEQLRGNLKMMTQEMALMDVLGPNPAHMFDDMVEWAKTESKRRGVFKEDGDKIARAMIEELMGMNGVKGSIAVHNFFRGAKQLNVANLLGSMIFSQMSDNGTAIATSRAIGAAMDQWGLMKADYYKSKELTEFARSSGAAFDIAINTILRYNDSATSTGWTGSAAALTLKMTGANLMTRVHREAFATFVSNHVGSMTRRYDWDTLPAGDKTIFEAHGFTKQDWDILRLAQVNKGGKDYTLVGAKEVMDIPDADIARAISWNIRAIEAENRAFLDKMDAKNLDEAAWVAAREQKFDAYKAKLQGMIDAYQATRDKRVQDYSDSNVVKFEQMLTRLEQADIDMQIAKENIKALNEKRADNFFDDVKRGVEWYGRRRSEIGERLGAARHSAKLIEARHASEYESLSKSLIDKKNELFGPERVEDGLVTIGKVTKAAKELDAYVAKMEKRIKNATKKDGTPKKGKEGTIDRAEKLQEGAEIEFKAIQQRADAALDELKQKVVGSQAEVQGFIDAVNSKKARAAAEADIASYLETEKSLDKIQALTDTLEFRFNQTADTLSNRAESLGYRKAAADARMKQLVKQEEAYKKQAGREVFAKATDLEKRIDARMKELDEFISRSDERVANRQQIADDYNAALGSRIAKEIANARRDAAMTITTMMIDEAEMAVLQPSLRSRVALTPEKGNFVSELGSAMTQFKQFPWAMLRQHYMERANSMGVKSGVPYGLSLIALTSVFGGIGLLMSDIAAGRDPREIYNSDKPIESLAKFGGQALVKGGGLGFLADMFIDYEGRDPIEKLTGPFGGDVVSVGKFAQSLASGDQDKIAKQAINTTKDLAPFQNFWATRAALHNYLVADLYEMASPGYMDRMNNLAQKNYGSQYYMGMGNDARMPDFGNMFKTE